LGNDLGATIRFKCCGEIQVSELPSEARSSSPQLDPHRIVFE
jgi:hypothetical protein